MNLRFYFCQTGFLVLLVMADKFKSDTECIDKIQCQSNLSLYVYIH